MSGFARITFEFGPSTQDHFGLILSYEGFRFSQSGTQMLTVSGAAAGYYSQPESYRNVYGMRGVYYFR